jgi:hypothetical protein
VRRDFLIDIVQRDKADRIQSYLKANRATCDRLLSEEHLQLFYWEDPTPDAARRARGHAKKAGKGYHIPEAVQKVLLPLIDRVSMLRSQLVHGQSTHGSSVNRIVVEPGAELLHGLVLTILTCIVNDGLYDPDDAWEPAPFPPMQPHFRR